MRHRPGRIIAAVGIVLVTALAAVVVAEDLVVRLERLENEGEYDLALALLADHIDRGAAQTDALRWTRARLVTDPDRFDRLASELSGGKSVEDSLVQTVAIARAQEQFARGQYLSALDGLRALPVSAEQRFGQLRVLRGMAAAAAGQVREARVSLEDIEDSHASFALSQVLLADLRLRAGQPTQALSHADRALRISNASVKPQALYARARALEQLGRTDEAADSKRDILEKHERTVEAAWIREQPVADRRSTPSRPPVPEVDAPEARQDYALQFGAFHDRRLALKLAGQLVGRVAELQVERDLISSPAWYRVVGGSYRTLGTADAQRTRLAAEGISSVVLRPGRGGQ